MQIMNVDGNRVQTDELADTIVKNQDGTTETKKLPGKWYTCVAADKLSVTLDGQACTLSKLGVGDNVGFSVTMDDVGNPLVRTIVATRPAKLPS